MSDISELERRITTALDRIGQAIDRPASGHATGELEETLQAERDANAQLAERVRALKERDNEQQEKLERLTRQLDTQGLEVQRMRKNVIALREAVRFLREAQAEGLSEPHLINNAMLAELDALRATRLTEIAEMDEILAELKPLIAEVQDA